ncbi:hypothetical protein [Rouxiella sp. WC2420]|uniref:Uncharacterized protein n=1 Tax=Rouxiella sp. WC2420 TaxID=3234145 RepID=A0AB39VLQ6_9GAMM
MEKSINFIDNLNHLNADFFSIDKKQDLLSRKLLMHHRHGENTFFSFYHQQPHASAEIFLWPWEYCINNGWPDNFQSIWQFALDRLYQLSHSAANENNLLNRYWPQANKPIIDSSLRLGVIRWQRGINTSLNSWQTPRKAEDI